MTPSSAPVQATGSHRIVQLDGLRGVAIATVFVFHAFAVPGLWMGVDLFFVLSGFLITGILFNQKKRRFGQYIRHFYSRRARRILPAYVVALIVSGILFGFSFLPHWYMLFGLMNFQVMTTLPGGPAELPLWSLAVEEQFYFVWPLIIFVLGRSRLIFCTAILVLLAPVLRYVCTPLFADHAPIYHLLPFRMDTLAAGALIALLWPRIRERLDASPLVRRAFAVVGALAVAGGFGALMVLHHHGIKTTTNTPLGNAVLYSLTVIIMSAALLLALIGVGKQVLSLWPLVYLGRISFSLYLIHLTALRLAPHRNPWIALAASLSYSTLMWFVVEKPIITPGQSREKVLVSGQEALS